MRRESLVWSMALCGGMAILVFFYGLHVSFFVPLGICGWIVGKKLCGYRRKERGYEEQYVQVTAYLEQLLCSYRRLGHVGRALEDCRTLFPRKTVMGEAVFRARHIMLTGEGVLDSGILEAAFGEIETVAKSRRMRIIHRFLCNAEQKGGECGASLDILLEDLELWRNRTGLYQNRKRFIRTECAIATLMSVFLCYVSRLLTPAELGFRISDSAVYQCSTAVILVSFLILFLVIAKKLSGEWIDTADRYEGKEKLRLEKMYACFRGMAAQSFLSRHMAKKILARYVKNEFPYWLLMVTLYLQTESNYRALQSSLRETEGVFRQEVERLLEQIYDSPRDLEPYLSFFGELGIQEVQSGMKILYSVSAQGYEDSRRQLDFLVSQNNRLMDRAEAYRFSAKTAGMSMLKQLPMILSCVKLLIDLVNLLALTMGSFQSVTWQ